MRAYLVGIYKLIFLMGNTDSRPFYRGDDKIIDITGKGLELIPYRFKKSSSVTTLILTYNRIQKLPKHATQLATISLAANGLEIIPEHMMKRLLSYPKLKSIDLTCNFLTEYPMQFNKLPKIRSLNFFGNRIKHAEVRSSTLDKIDFQQNLFTKMPELPSRIMGLSIDYNKISHIKINLPKLLRFSISLNSIESFSSDSHMPETLYIDISRNRLKRLPDLSKITPKLRVLDCSDNFIAKFPIMSKELSEIGLRRTSITEFPHNFAELFPCLTVIDASETKVAIMPAFPSSVKVIAFIECDIEQIETCDTPNLEKIFLSKNKLSEVPQFRNNVASDIYLSQNQISSIDNLIVSEQLTKLDLSDNLLTEIPENIFELPKLSELYLTRNKIKQIPSKLVDSKLQILALNENPLEEPLQDIPLTLTKLYLAYCGIKSLPSNLSSSQKLTELVVSGNKLKGIPLICNLENLYASRNSIKQFPKLPDTIKIVDLSFNNIENLEDELKFSNIIDLDLSFNLIKKAPRLTTPQLKYFKIAHNSKLKGQIDVIHLKHLLIIDVDGTKIVFDEAPPVRELMTNQSEIANSPFVKFICCSKGVGFSEMCGSRESMEDAIVIRENIIPGISTYAVFDGHGGARSSTVAAFKYPRYLVQNLEFTEDHLKSAIHEVNESVKELDYTDGSTANIVLRQGKKLIFANVGDARGVVLREDGSIKFKTQDHKPILRSEYERVRDEGSRIYMNRTDGVLAITRSLGDFCVNGVSHEPDLSVVDLEPEDKWLLVGCDGVFDVISDKHIGLIAQKAKNPFQMAYDIRNLAYASGSQDNISAIVVDLQINPDVVENVNNDPNVDMGSLSKIIGDKNIFGSNKLQSNPNSIIDGEVPLISTPVPIESIDVSPLRFELDSTNNPNMSVTIDRRETDSDYDLHDLKLKNQYTRPLSHEYPSMQQQMKKKLNTTSSLLESRRKSTFSQIHPQRKPSSDPNEFYEEELKSNKKLKKIKQATSLKRFSHKLEEDELGFIAEYTGKSEPSLLEAGKAAKIDEASESSENKNEDEQSSHESSKSEETSSATSSSSSSSFENSDNDSDSD